MGWKYYRIIRINYDMVMKWLNVPKGFEVEAMRYNDFDNNIEIKLRCPVEERFKTKDNQMIPATDGIIHINEHGIIDRMEWQELQEGIDGQGQREGQAEA